jgi:hypothetical protein
MRVVRAAVIVGLALAGAASARFAVAEKANMTPQMLRETATHVVVGEVRSIYARKSSEGDWRYVRYVAEVRVQTVEKGTGMEPGGLVYARYWTREWARGNTMPTDTAGHRGLPSEGQVRRIYLARNAYDGFGTENKDGGFNVIGANGFEVPAPAEAPKPPR